MLRETYLVVDFADVGFHRADYRIRITGKFSCRRVDGVGLVPRIIQASLGPTLGLFQKVPVLNAVVGIGSRKALVFYQMRRGSSWWR